MSLHVWLNGAGRNAGGEVCAEGGAHPRFRLLRGDALARCRGLPRLARAPGGGATRATAQGCACLDFAGGIGAAPSIAAAVFPKLVPHDMSSP